MKFNNFMKTIALVSLVGLPYYALPVYFFVHDEDPVLRNANFKEEEKKKKKLDPNYVPMGKYSSAAGKSHFHNTQSNIKKSDPGSYVPTLGKYLSADGRSAPELSETEKKEKEMLEEEMQWDWTMLHKIRVK